MPPSLLARLVLALVVTAAALLALRLRGELRPRHSGRIGLGLAVLALAVIFRVALLMLGALLAGEAMLLAWPATPGLLALRLGMSAGGVLGLLAGSLALGLIANRLRRAFGLPPKPWRRR